MSHTVARLDLTSQSSIQKDGGGSMSLFGELLSALDEKKPTLDVLASHSHPNTGTINEGGQVAGHLAGLLGHRNNLGRITW